MFSLRVAAGSMLSSRHGASTLGRQRIVHAECPRVSAPACAPPRSALVDSGRHLLAVGTVCPLNKSVWLPREQTGWLLSFHCLICLHGPLLTIVPTTIPSELLY